MSQTHGELSGARPTQGYSACDHSLTHITLGASVHQFQPTLPSSQTVLLQQQQHPVHQERLDESGPAGAASGLHNLPTGGSGSGAFEGGNSSAPIRGAFLEPPLGGPSATVADSQQAAPQGFLFPPNVYDNSMMLKEQGGDLGDHNEENAFDDQDDGRDGGDYDDAGDGNSQGSGKRSRARRPHLQGRFSGRLTTKEDERRLADECKLLGPLLGGVGKRGDKSRLTLAKIVRGVATGDVRRFCEERERAIAMLKAKLAAIDPEAAASVPVNAIQLPSAALGGPLGGLGGMGLGLGGGSMGTHPGGSMGSMGAYSHGPHGHMHPQQQQQQQQLLLEPLQRENMELQHEVVSLRVELQARERLLLELQDTGIISGFVPTSIPMDDHPRGALTHPGGGGGAMTGGTRSQSTDLAPPAAYGLPPRHPSYGTQQQQPMASYGGPSQMSMPQSSAHVSGGMEAGPGAGAGGGPMGSNHAGATLVLGGGHQQQQQQHSHPMAGQGQHPQQQPGGGMQHAATGNVLHLGGGDSNTAMAAAAMPAMSEHSRAGRPMKRQAVLSADMAGGGGAYGEVPRTLSHPQLGRGGMGGGGYPHIDLQQQLSSLQAQVEQLQNLSQGGARAAAGYLLPMRERGGPGLRMAGGGMGAGGAAGGMAHYGMAASPFMSGAPVGPQGGLLMLPGHGSEADAHTYHHHHHSAAAHHHHSHHPHTVLSAPLHLQAVKPPPMYDDVGGGGSVGPVGRDVRDTLPGGGGAGATRHPAGAGGGAAAAHDPDVGYGSGAGGLEATLDHIFNSRHAAMRGEYDLPLELMLSQEGGKGAGGGGGAGGLH